MATVADFKAARAEKKRRDYADLVLRAYDRLERAAKREVLDRATEVNAKAKERI